MHSFTRTFSTFEAFPFYICKLFAKFAYIFKEIRKFLHLLDLRKEDFAQELELQNIKGEITKKIRLTQGLEKDLDSMDIKIGKKFFSKK